MSLPRLITAAESLTDPNLGRWLKNATARIRDGQDPAEALSLTGQAAMDERDRHLRAAARTLAPEATDWRAAKILADLVAAMLCAECPSSQRRLFDCLTDARGPAASENPPKAQPRRLESA